MSLSRAFYIYTAGSLLAGAVPLLLLPVLTRHLSETDYGIVATITTLITFVSPSVMWGTAAAVVVEHGRYPLERFRVYFVSMLRLPLVVFAATMTLALVAAPWVSDRLGIPSYWIAVVPVFAMLSVFPQLFSSVLRMRNQPVAFAGFELFSAAFVVAISLLLVVGFDQGWQGRMLAIAIASMAGTLIALIWLARQGYLTTEFDRGDLEDAFRFGAGVVPHDLCNQAVRVADRLFLVAMVGLAGAGQYAVASQIASVMLTVLAAFNKAWAPYLFSQLRDARAGTHEAIVKISYLIICCAVLFFLVFNAAVPLLYNLFVDAKFKPSMDYVVWLTLGYVFMAAYMTYVDYIFYVKKTHFLSLITMFNLACNLLLNYLFIKRFGAIGAAYAFAMTMFVVMVMAFLISNRLHPMPWFHWFKKWI